MNMHKSDFGLIGLGVMGRNISLNVAEKGYTVSVYNRSSGDEKNVVPDFLEEYKSFKNISGYTQVSEFIQSIERPRNIFLMIKAGEAIDTVIEQLLPLLSEDDIIIDGGNSHYTDTLRRSKYLNTKGINFVGCGVSGGEKGARNGPEGANTQIYRRKCHGECHRLLYRRKCCDISCCTERDRPNLGVHPLKQDRLNKGKRLFGVF